MADKNGQTTIFRKVYIAFWAIDLTEIASGQAHPLEKVVFGHVTSVTWYETLHTHAKYEKIPPSDYLAMARRKCSHLYVNFLMCTETHLMRDN